MFRKVIEDVLPDLLGLSAKLARHEAIPNQGPHQRYYGVTMDEANAAPGWGCKPTYEHDD
jgi:hypothetical protein